MVYQTSALSQHIVSLRARTCSCLQFQDLLIPCRHAIAAIRDFNCDIDDYISELYFTSSYKETYKMATAPIRWDDLIPNKGGDCEPPQWKDEEDTEKRGRPAKKRKLKAHQRAKETLSRLSDERRRELRERRSVTIVPPVLLRRRRCGYCQKPGHDLRKCEASGVEDYRAAQRSRSNHHA
jgi:hypothetical protein